MAIEPTTLITRIHLADIQAFSLFGAITGLSQFSGVLDGVEPQAQASGICITLIPVKVSYPFPVALQKIEYTYKITAGGSSAITIGYIINENDSHEIIAFGTGTSTSKVTESLNFSGSTLRLYSQDVSFNIAIAALGTVSHPISIYGVTFTMVPVKIT